MKLQQLVSSFSGITLRTLKKCCNFNYEGYRKKIISYRYYSGELKKLPVYHWYNQFYVQFAVQKNEKINACLSVELKNVHSPEEGIRELQVITSDLQKIYRLPFTPNIYMNGKPVEQMQQKPG